MQAGILRRMMLGGEFIKEKAKEIAKELNISDHKFSDGWLQGFLRRHDLHYKKCHGEEKSSNKQYTIASKSAFWIKVCKSIPLKFRKGIAEKICWVIQRGGSGVNFQSDATNSNFCFILD